MVDLETRPRPLLDAAETVTRIQITIGTLMTMLVGWGVVTLTQHDAVEGLVGLFPGVVQAVFGVLTAFGVVRRAEPLVTPVADPRDDAGRPLRPVQQ